jgi:hypothetical protein
MNDGSEFGIVIRGVPDLLPPHVKVLMVKEGDLSVVRVEVFDLHLSDVNRTMKINHVIAVKTNLEVPMIQRHAGGEGVSQISLLDVPMGVACPSQTGRSGFGGRGVDPKPTRSVSGMILLTDVRKIDIPNLITVIEC